MATPDPSTLTSSSQIFSSTSNTLPQIRAIHKSLHVAIDDKAARLRAQVGGSYRELLGTADAIVQMRTDMDSVQDTLAKMGARCGRAVVGAKVAGLGKFVRESEGGQVEVGIVARARLLEGCALAVARVLRGEQQKQQNAAGSGDTKGRLGARLVAAAKVLVLSRLLVKSLSEDDITSPAVVSSVEASKRSLGGLRRRLLRSIDRVLDRVAGDDVAAHRDDVSRALCAYSLATSSGAKDVLRHLLHVRAEAMALVFEKDGEGGDRERKTADVLRCLELYTQTLLDVQALVPGRLTEALAGLKKTALLADGTLRSIEGLRLDIYEKWCGEDIQYFKPYIRHDDLDGKQARELLAGWASKGGEVLLQGLEKTLERLFEFKAIVEMRTSVLQLWIKDGGKAKGFDAAEMLDKLRRSINRHMLQVLNMKVSKLRLVGSEVTAALESWQTGIVADGHRHQTLWDDDAFDMELSNGAAQFAQDVVGRYYGRSDTVSKAVASYRSWHQVVDDVAEVVAQLRRQRWDNDVDEIEDEDTIERRQQLLSRDDPQLLHDRLNAALDKAIGGLAQHLVEEWDKYKAGENNGAIAMYFVRIIRDIRSRLPALEGVSDFGLPMVPSLHESIAATVAVTPLDQFSSGALTRKVVVGRALWDGEPPLPTSPSPGLFTFLRDLSVAMGDAGMDLWSPAAVLVLKQHLVARLSVAWREVLEASSVIEDTKTKVEEAAVEAQDDESGEKVEDKKTTNEVPEDQKEMKDDQEEEAPSSAPGPSSTSDPSQRTDLLLQWLFDISMLETCLSSGTHKSAAELSKLADSVYEQTGLGDEDARRRLVKASQDYWKKTNLLFGLLAA